MVSETRWSGGLINVLSLYFKKKKIEGLQSVLWNFEPASPSQKNPAAPARGSHPRVYIINTPAEMQLSSCSLTWTNPNPIFYVYLYASRRKRRLENWIFFFYDSSYLEFIELFKLLIIIIIIYYLKKTSHGKHSQPH